MASANDIVTRIITALQLSDPAWDINPGSPEYKIIDAFSNQLATANNNNTLQNYSLDPNSMSGNQLDQFVSYFGIQRQQGTRATGTVTVSIGSPATAAIYIPMGTQFYVPTPSSNGVIVYFQTTSQATIGVGASYVEIPVEATVAGSSGNVLQNQINGISTALVGINTVTNAFATTGGSDPETDVQLRARFQATAFRNESGTADQYLGTVTDNTSVTNANVIGTNEFYTETLPVVALLFFSAASGTFNLTLQGNTVSGITYTGTIDTMVANLQAAIDTLCADFTPQLTAVVTYVPSLYSATGPQYGYAVNFIQVVPTTDILTGTNPSSGVLNVYGAIAISDIPDSKYAYPAGAETVTYGLYAPGGSYGIGIPGVDYTYEPSDGGTPPALIEFQNPGPNYLAYFTPGNIIGLQSQYIPESSRNWIDEGGNQIFNVDIFAQGSNPYAAVSETAVLSGATFSSLQQMVTLEGQQPPSDDYFIPLVPQPSLSASNVTSGVTSLVQGYAYDPTYTIGTFGVAPTGGTFTLTVTTDWGGIVAHTTPAIPYNASAAQIQTVLLNLNIGLFSVTGGPLGGTALFIVQSAYQPNTGLYTSGYPQITASYSGLTGDSGSVAPSLVTTEFYMVFEDDVSATTNPTGARQGSPLAVSGIGITSAAFGAITVGPVTPVTVQYNFDKLINDLNNSVQQVTLINQNALVHSVVSVNLLVNLVVSYSTGTTQSQINASITTALTNYFSTITFNGEVVVADILKAALGASGVQNVRLATPTDNATFYGLQMVQPDGVTVTSTSLTNLEDFFLASNELPTLFGVNTYLRALGSFSV